MLHFQTLARKLKENRHGSTSVPEKVIGHIQEQEEGERDNILQGCGHALPHIVLANQGQIDKCKDRVQHSAHNGGRVEPVHAWLSLGHQDFLSLMDEIFWNSNRVWANCREIQCLTQFSQRSSPKNR